MTTKTPPPARLATEAEMSHADTRGPDIRITNASPSGVVNVHITTLFPEVHILRTSPYEVLGPYEVHPTLADAEARTRSIFEALHADTFPSPITQEVA